MNDQCLPEVNLLLTGKSKNLLHIGNHKNYTGHCMGFAWCCTGCRRKALEQQQKFCLFLGYMEWIWAQIITSGKKGPLTYGHFTVRTPKSSQAISQQVKLFPLMQRESKSWQFLCGRGLFLPAQAVNDCLKHKALERQAGNDNESRNQPNMNQLHWNSTFW